MQERGWNIVDVGWDDPPTRIRGNLELPLPGGHVEAHTLHLAGWVVGETAPAVAVELVRDNRVFRRIPLGVERQDVQSALPEVDGADRAGFRGEASLLTDEAAVDVQVVAVLADSSRVGFCTVRACRAPTSGNPELVSVIIPCYRQAHFLSEAIESVLAQTWPSLELVVVDDGSDDNTGAVADRYPGVKCVHQSNVGLAASRNTGLRSSVGDYVVFLDADDRLLPSALETGMARLRQRPDAAFSAGLVRKVDSAGNVIQPPDPRIPPRPYLALLEECVIWAPAAVVYRRSTLDELGGFDVSVSASADYDVYLRASRDRPVDFHGAVVAEYRRHAGNMTRDSELILRSEMRVLRRQRRGARRVPGGSEALAAGLRRSRDVHGPEVAEGVARLFSERSWRRAFAGARTLLRSSPSNVLRLLRPRSVRELRNRVPGVSPPVGGVDLGHLRRLTPISEEYGFDRGQPIDRFYIEHFLAHHEFDIRGTILEIGDDTYARRFGGDRVVDVVVMHDKAGNPAADIVADLARADEIPSESFDCIVLTQTLQLIYDVRAAVSHVERLLKPGGVVLATVCGVSRVGDDAWSDHWCWSFTPYSAAKLFDEVFDADSVKIESYGNALAAVAFLHGLAAEELTREELDATDSRYPITIAIRAVSKRKVREARRNSISASNGETLPVPLILCYHRVADLELDPWGLAIPPDTLSLQLEWLRSAGSPVGLDAVASALRHGERLPANAFAVTFDDGYADCLEAMQELSRLEIPAAFFVPTSALVPGTEYWWDRLENLLFGSNELVGVLALQLRGACHEWRVDATGERPGGRREWRAWEQPVTPRETVYVELWKLLRGLDAPEQEAALRSVEEWACFNAQPRESHRRLSATDLKTIAAAEAMQIGGHTVNHVSLASLNRARQEEEIRASKVELDRLVGTPVTAFAYPYGQPSDYDATTMELVESAGYDSAYANVPDLGAGRGGLFELPRLQMHDWDCDALERRLRDRLEA